MEAVESGTLNVTETSKVFDIPRQTPSDRIKGKHTKVGGGRKTELTEDEKKILVDYCMFMAKCSHLLTVPVIKTFTWAIVKKAIDHQGFTLQMVQGGICGEVLKRHPEISLWRLDNLDHGRSRTNNQVVIQTFERRIRVN